MPQKLYVSGILVGLDQYGQIQVRMDAETRLKAETMEAHSAKELSAGNSTRSPLYGEHIAIKLGAISSKRVMEMEGQLVRVRACVNRYKFRSRQTGERVEGWNLKGEAFELNPFR
jgi:hypothetical protein